jgi:hypothetical protein
MQRDECTNLQQEYTRSEIICATHKHAGDLGSWSSSAEVSGHAECFGANLDNQILQLSQFLHEIRQLRCPLLWSLLLGR